MSDDEFRALAEEQSALRRVAMLVARGVPEHVEVAAYYVVSEALTNAVKHA